MPPKAKRGKPRNRVAKKCKAPKARQCAAARKRKTAMKKRTATKRCRVPKSRPRRRIQRAAASYKRRPRARPCRLGLGHEDPLAQFPSILDGISLGLGSVRSVSCSSYRSVEGSSLEGSSSVGGSSIEGSSSVQSSSLEGRSSVQGSSLEGSSSTEGSSLEGSSSVWGNSSAKGQKPKPKPPQTSSSQRLQQTVMMDFMPNLRSFESEVFFKLERPSSGHYAGVQATSLSSLDSEHYFTEDSQGSLDEEQGRKHDVSEED